MDTKYNEYDSTYRHQHNILSHMNFGLEKTEGSSDIAAFLNTNYDNMDDEELRYILLKCVNRNNMRSIILNYELSNLKPLPVPSMSFSEFAKEAVKIIKRYQWRAGGYLIEDIHWNIFNSTQKKWINKNELLICNTIDIKSVDDFETRQFIDKIVDRLNCIAENITVEVRFKDDFKHKLTKVMIWATDKNCVIDSANSKDYDSQDQDSDELITDVRL